MKVRPSSGSSGLLSRLHADGPTGAALSNSSDGGGSAQRPERATAHPARAARLEDVLRSLLASLCHWLLLQVNLPQQVVCSAVGHILRGLTLLCVMGQACCTSARGRAVPKPAAVLLCSLRACRMLCSQSPACAGWSALR